MKYTKTRTYKYKLERLTRVIVSEPPPCIRPVIFTPYACISQLHYSNRWDIDIDKGYRWDGSSGPTIDSDNTMLASLVHDVLYQMLREEAFGQLNNRQFKEARKWADLEYYRITRRKGMSWVRAKAHYVALRMFGASSADPKNRYKPEILEV